MEDHTQQLLNRSIRCPPVNVPWMLNLEDRRKTFRRGSFTFIDAIPVRSIVEDNKIVDFLRSQGFTIGELSLCHVVMVVWCGVV